MEAVDIEALLVSYLGPLCGATVSSQVPRGRVEEAWPFVTVERTGGGMDSIVVDRPVVAVQCWAATQHEASALALLVDSLMRDADALPGVDRVARAGLAHFPSLEPRSERYQATYQITTSY